MALLRSSGTRPVPVSYLPEQCSTASSLPLVEHSLAEKLVSQWGGGAPGPPVEEAKACEVLTPPREEV